MQLDCASVRDDIDAYAIGALDADEARAVASHIAECDACAALLAEATEDATTAMALAAPLVPSSPVLKARVMASAAVLADIRGPRRSRWWPAAAAVLVAAVATLFAWGVAMQTRVNSLEDHNTTLRRDATAQSEQLHEVTDSNATLASTVRVQDAIVDLVTEPDVRRTQLTGTEAAPDASGRYMWSPSRDSGALVAAKLPALSAGQVYEMWIVYPDRRWVSGGQFTVGADGAARFVVAPTADDGEPDGAMPAWFCVTLEPAAADSNQRQMVLRSDTQ